MKRLFLATTISLILSQALFAKEDVAAEQEQTRFEYIVIKYFFKE